MLTASRQTSAGREEGVAPPAAVPFPHGVAVWGYTFWEGRTEALLGLTRGLGRRCGLQEPVSELSAHCGCPAPDAAALGQDLPGQGPPEHSGGRPVVQVGRRGVGGD